MLLAVFCTSAAMAQTPLPAYYSLGSNIFQVTQPSPQITGSGNVMLGINAADGDISTAATLSTDISLGVPVALRLGLTSVAPAGYRAGVLLANATGLLSLQALGTVKLRTYLSGASPELREEKIVRADVVRASLLATDKPTQLEFISSKSFDAVEIEIAGLASVFYTTNIYYAYAVRPGVQTTVSGFVSRFAASAGQYSASTANGICVATDVDNPENVADADLTNYASFKSVLTVACQPALRVKLAGLPTTGAPAGYYAGFVVGQSGLLDVGVLSGLRVNTYLNGTMKNSFTGPNLLELTLLPGGKAQVTFQATTAFDEVSIERTGLITAVDNLQIYYGFGLAPQAFQGVSPVLSDFGAPTGKYSNSAPQGATITVGVGPLAATVTVTIAQVVDPERAADSDVTNYAQINTTGLGILTGTAKANLKLRINGTGRAGNRVGMVVSDGSGLLDLSALQRLTLLTYDASNNLIETKTGSNLLNVSLLPDGSNRNKISFLATRDFSYVELEVNSAASVLSSTRVYYAFAEDVALLSVQAPLPVELTAFTGRWNNGAAELNWKTASEHNSSHFVVERSIGGEAAFLSVGQVTAAGNSSSAHNYQLRDVEAATTGVPTLYYRLRQVDTDGQYSFSSVVALAVGKAAATAMMLYPNPATAASFVTVDFSAPEAGRVLRVYSQLGQLVRQLPADAASLTLPTANLAPGIYSLTIGGQTSASKTVSQRLIVNQ